MYPIPILPVEHFFAHERDRTVLFHQLIVNHLGLKSTDHKCLDIVYDAGRITAGELTAKTAMTTGHAEAIAGMITASLAPRAAMLEHYTVGELAIVVRFISEQVDVLDGMKDQTTGR